MTRPRIAIIGMAGIFPKAPNLAAYWHNVCTGVDAIVDVPAQRWDPVFYDPTSDAPDRFYANRGGFIDDFAEFDATAFGIMPLSAKGAEPEQLLTLQVAVDALADAGYRDRDFRRETTSVILGRGNYIGAGTTRLLNATRGAQQLQESLSILLPELGAEKLALIKREFQAQCGIGGPDTAIGLVPNLLASRIANRLDLQGSAYTLDAACASALVAVDQACRELQEGRSDLSIAGGVHLCQDLVFWSVFCQLGALSRTQVIRPFDRRADGLLIGEGIGLLVLKRLDDARRDGDRIYAVIRGSGVASDGRDLSLMLPRVEGQVLALSRAWQEAGVEPDSIGLLEAHGTATPAGDSAELETLRRFFGPGDSRRERAVLGSVKSMIGHAMPAAGAAGLIKAALSAYHGICPPTLHCEEPNPAVAATRFRVTGSSEPWDDRLRRAAVNAFGFGGVNAHIVLDGPEERSAPAGKAPAGKPGAARSALILAAPSREALLDALDAGRSDASGAWRLAVFDPTPARLAVAREAVAAGRSRHGRDGIHVSPGGLIAQGGKVAFLFPGVEAAFDPRVEDIAAHFNMVAPDLDAGSLAFQGAGVILLNRFLQDVAAGMGLKADVVAGHSIGEWSGMIAAGMFERLPLDGFMSALDPTMLQVADVAYLAVGAGAERVAPWVEDIAGVAISHDNCPHQSILCGPEAQIAEAARRMKEKRVLCELLPFRSGFHSPAMAVHRSNYQKNLERIALTPASLPLWSATTCAPYPKDPEGIRALFGEHLVKPVRFRELILALHAAGVRAFVQVGTGSLGAFVNDVLAGKPHLAVALVAPQRPGMEQLRRAAAALYVEGATLDLERIGLGQPAAPGPAPRPNRALRLHLGVPLVRMNHPSLEMGSRRALPAMSKDPVRLAFDASLRELEAAQEAVVQAYAGTTQDPSSAQKHSEPMGLSLQAYPELIDHSLIPQPGNWPTLADRAPAVPMTMSIALLMEAAARRHPGRIPIAVEKVKANTWLRVEPAVETTIECERIDASRVKVSISGYVEGIVTVADHYPDAPQPSREGIGEEREFDIPVDAVYRDGWLFHGPQYQGLISIDASGTAGVRGTLLNQPAKGALLDNAGQLLGLWVMQACANDRLAMPIRVGRVDFYGPDPTPGDVLACSVWVRQLGRREVRADMELRQGDRVWARITGWEDWRFFTGGNIFAVMRQPGRHLLSAAESAYMVLEDPGWTSATLEFLMRRFFSFQELEAMGGLKMAQRQQDWLYGRIAAKDAVRNHLFKLGHGEVFPLEVPIEADPAGRPLVRGRFAGDLRVSIAHKPGIACAIAAEGVSPGIDIEKIEPRGHGFASLAFSQAELDLLPGHDRDEWLTRFWSAKEAAGKAAGTGLAGNPKGLRITAVEGNRIMVAGRWVETCARGQHVVAWTIQ